MSEKEFIKNKLSLIKKDNQAGFKDFVGPLQDVAQDAKPGKRIKVPIDGNWFKLEFSAVSVKEDRLIINAEREYSGFVGEQYRVQFVGTRAAYLYGFYSPRHPVGSWSFLYWDVRAYANHPLDKSKRVYVSTFRADVEISKMIKTMEARFGTKNTYNKYI